MLKQPCTGSGSTARPKTIDTALWPWKSQNYLGMKFKNSGQEQMHSKILCFRQALFKDFTVKYKITCLNVAILGETYFSEIIAN